MVIIYRAILIIISNRNGETRHFQKVMKAVLDRILMSR